jgi:hypothetical protein
MNPSLPPSTSGLRSRPASPAADATPPAGAQEPTAAEAATRRSAAIGALQRAPALAGASSSAARRPGNPSTSPLALAAAGNKAMQQTREIMHLGPGNQVFAIANHGSTPCAMTGLSRRLLIAFYASVPVDHPSQRTFDHKLFELFVRWQNQRLDERAALFSAEDRAEARQFSPQSLRPLEGMCGGVQPTLLRMSAMFGTGNCDEFATMTACLAAHEMAAQGIDGHTATFMLSPSEHPQNERGYVMTHVVAGIYNKAQRREGVDAPLGHGLMVLDAWQEQARAAPAACTRYHDRLHAAPLTSFRVRGGAVQVVQGNDKFSATGKGTTQPAHDFPGPGALNALSQCGISINEAEQFLRSPGSMVSLQGLDLTDDDRAALAQLADELHAPFIAGSVLQSSNPFNDVNRTSEVAARLRLDPEFARANNVFGATSAMLTDARALLRSNSGSIEYPLRGHEQPYPGQRPSSPAGRAQLIPPAVVTTDWPPSDASSDASDGRR